MIAYGDDNVLNVSDEVPEYNQERMAEEFARFGMTYTDELKTGVLSDKTLEQVAFLKRGFSYSHTHCFCFAPLALPSILEAFNWKKNCQVICQNLHLVCDRLTSVNVVSSRQTLRWQMKLIACTMIGWL